jgi:outer membrane protein TolC
MQSVFQMTANRSPCWLDRAPSREQRRSPTTKRGSDTPLPRFRQPARPVRSRSVATPGPIPSRLWTLFFLDPAPGSPRQMVSRSPNLLVSRRRMPVRSPYPQTFIAVVACAAQLCVLSNSSADDPPLRYVATTVPPAGSSAAPAARRGYSLRRCLELAEANYPKIAEARAKTSYYRGQLDEARTAPFSQWSLTAGLGIAPTVRGTSVYSPNTEVSLSSNMGMAWRATIDGFVPLWTFGKITNLVDAASAQVKLGEHEERKERNQLKMDVRKAYFGLQLARSSAHLMKTAADQLDAAIDKFQGQVDSGEGDEIDLLKLRTFRAELDGRLSEAERYASIALAGLRFLSGVSGSFDIDNVELHVARHRLGPVSLYLQAAQLYRPDINMAHVGVQARRAQLELARSRFYPDIGVGLSASWARAPEISDQLNPFVRDDANFFRYGFALGLRWNLDLWPASARLDQARAQLEQTRAIERLALGAVGMEVETAYAEVTDAQRREKAYGQAESYAKRWMIAITQGIDLGTQEERDLVDPARQYALQRFSHLNAIMDLNVALSKLALVTGWEEIAPDGT